MTIAELISQYRLAPGERARREDPRHAQWWIQHMGQEPIAALTAERVCCALDRLAAHNRSPSTVAFYLRFLRRVCAWAALMTLLPKDPCAGMELPKERTPPMRILTAAEEQAVCAMLGPPYALWVRLAIMTGLKQSEQFTLRWRDVDLDRATLLLPQPTTGALCALQLQPAAVEVLRQLRQEQQPSLWVFPDPQNPSRPVNIHAFYVGRWATAVHRANIPWCAWKDLRHTCGVRLAQRGLPANDITRAMRQRENRQAYTYRAWQADGGPTPPRPTAPKAPLFTELADGELRNAMLRDLSLQPLTLGEGARLYAVHHLKQRPSRDQFERLFRQYWQPWHERPLESLTRKEVRAWYLTLAHTPGQANKALTLLRSLYNWALSLELITSSNPATGIRRFPHTPRERFLSVDELHRVMAGFPHLPAKPRAFFLVLLLTGARRSEARSMRWIDIDASSRLWRKPTTKNKTSQLVPLPAQAMEALQSLPRTSEWIFPGRHGRPWSVGSVEKEWGVLRRRWGLDDVRLHDLRRTCASYLAISGENLPTIQSVLNHRSLTPTSIYARLNTKAIDRALQRQADRFFGIPEAGPPLQGGTIEHRTEPLEIAGLCE